jgi:hypothetical protein
MPQAVHGESALEPIRAQPVQRLEGRPRIPDENIQPLDRLPAIAVIVVVVEPRFECLGRGPGALDRAQIERVEMDRACWSGGPALQRFLS